MMLLLQVNSFLSHLCVSHAIAIVLTLMVEMPMARLWKILLDVLDLGDRGTIKKRIQPASELATTAATPSEETHTNELSTKVEADSTLIS